jgi:hypothetical protein
MEEGADHLDKQDIRRGHIHNLSESLNVLEYIIKLVDERGYRFADDDAPHYIEEMKKAVVRIRAARDSIQSE